MRRSATHAIGRENLPTRPGWRVAGAQTQYASPIFAVWFGTKFTLVGRSDSSRPTLIIQTESRLECHVGPRRTAVSMAPRRAFSKSVADVVQGDPGVGHLAYPQQLGHLA